jgi:hypothetical protein
VSGSILIIQQGYTAPAGFTLLGSQQFKYKDTTNHDRTILVNVYQKQ